MSWEIFESEAGRYEAWYATRSGRRVDRAEQALLTWLLARFPSAARVLEIGCGTGHFTRWLVGQSRRVVGLDRSPAMLAEARTRNPGIPVILAEARHLPLRDAALDLVLFVTTVEFLEDAEAALREAARVAREGLILIALNRWSVGGFTRRWAPSRARHRLLREARDQSVRSLRALAARAAGARLEEMRWTSTLFPASLWRMRAPILLGDILGLAVRLSPPGPVAPKKERVE